jgi:hypothetical protein
MGQRRLAHEVCRAAQYCSEGNQDSRNRIGYISSTQKLQYKEIIVGIGYEKVKDKHKQNNINDDNSNNNTTKDRDGNDNKENSDIERGKRERAATESSC